MRLEALPDVLRERTRPLRDTTPSRGQFVLYWTHHALRAHENPALDVAVWAGNRLGLPVLVYQGLGAGHRFDSDRHHTFILEGAADLATQLDGRGIAYRLFAPTSAKSRSPLRSLARKAALVVVEDFPAPPFPRWTARLAEAAGGPVWAVDASCVMPMQSFGRAFERAFKFRDRAWSGMRERAAAGWTDIEPEVAAPNGEGFDRELGFEAVDPRSLDIASFIARRDIDHSIGPVAHARGGTAAGEARWERFKEKGLASYHRQRNDAAVQPPRGVSRLSAYFHYGFLSPLKVAREALADGGRGAEKYLDELLIWRELAYLYCFHHHERVESLDALPGWAQETLDRHRHDQRPELISWQSLLRGQTGYDVWDLAQRSLLIHGEMHNNLRMTWGKALLRWTRSPEQALAMLVDLNHRLALDGNDPASYGGLLWCLGLFDRAFTPEQPVFGSVRGRSLDAHRRRLDLETYGRRISRPANGERQRVAVIGAGLSGLVAGQILQDAGHEVQIFDKGRRPGGRLSTRVDRDTRLRFDHGAQYFTARNKNFQRTVWSWIDEGAVALWTGRLVELRGGEQTVKRGAGRYVGVPGMQSVAAHLARGLDVRQGVRIEQVHVDQGAGAGTDQDPVEGKNSGITLKDQDGARHGDFDALLVTAPAAQTADLLEPVTALAESIRQVEMLPCWAVMVAFEKPLFGSEAGSREGENFDGAFVHDSPVAWAARDGSKPGRAGETWVLHASAEWSQENLELDAEDAARQLLGAFFEAIGCRPVPTDHIRAHRWRYARPAQAPGSIFWDASLKIGAGGDWSHDARVEGAFLAGQALAGRLLGQLAAEAVDPKFEADVKTEDAQLALELS